VTELRGAEAPEETAVTEGKKHATPWSSHFAAVLNLELELQTPRSEGVEISRMRPRVFARSRQQVEEVQQGRTGAAKV
jgi:hypothetical protein